MVDRAPNTSATAATWSIIRSTYFRHRSTSGNSSSGVDDNDCQIDDQVLSPK